MSGKRWSSRSRCQSGSSGRSDSSGRVLRRAAEFLLRAGAWYALIYLLWLPLQAGFMRFLAGASERALRLIQRPPLISSVVATGNVIVIHSYVTGLATPMASWNGENIHFFMVATIALALAAPLRGVAARVRMGVTAAAVGGVMSMAICVVQLETVAETYSMQYLGVTLHTAREKLVLERANEALIMVGMLLVPAFLFLLSYVYRWSEPRPPARSRQTVMVPRGRHHRSPRRLAIEAVGILALCLILRFFIVGTRQSDDPHAYLAGWAKLAALNPAFAPAHVNLGTRLEEEGRVDEAIEEYRRALHADPDRFAAHYNLGNALVKMGLYADATRSYERALNREPDNALVHKNLAIALLYLDRPCEALTHLERSAELDPRAFGDAKVASQIADLKPRCGR